MLLLIIIFVNNNKTSLQSNGMFQYEIVSKTVDVFKITSNELGRNFGI